METTVGPTIPFPTADQSPVAGASIPTFQPLALLRLLADNLERDYCTDEANLVRSAVEALAFDDADKHLLLSVAEHFDGLADDITGQRHRALAAKYVGMAKRIREIVECR